MCFLFALFVVGLFFFWSVGFWFVVGGGGGGGGFCVYV